ncbi:sensor histidine kinase [Natronobeatus ordinarius]|uniref:sensor histidine kinase n=1 Tax=Natronobeatus ordinarius TaxID=2963433 RepID=UPI0020CC02A3|nr:HAMP domain-containing sensor histidine kinase [Natronobeatus ordinarius]
MVTPLYDWDGGSVVISGLGVVLLGLYVGYVTTQQYYLEGPAWLFPLGFLFIVVLSVGLVYGGYWLVGSELEADFVFRVAIWCFTGLIGALSLTFWPIFYQLMVGVTIEDPLFILLVSAGIGANAGLLIGMYEMRSRHQVEQIRRARDSFSFLNSLLRHNVRNAVNVIDRYATGIAEGRRGVAPVDNARKIQTKSDQITELVENAQVLVDRADGAATLDTVDFSRLLERQLETSREAYDGVELEHAIEPDVVIHGDEILSVVVDNLVDNAVEHNDRIRPEVTVTLETHADVAVLRVADNGPGIMDRYKERVFEPARGDDGGLGLYLVDSLVTDYGGSVSLEDNEPRGTIVTVELPLA